MRCALRSVAGCSTLTGSFARRWVPSVAAGVPTQSSSSSGAGRSSGSRGAACNGSRRGTGSLAVLPSGSSLAAATLKFEVRDELTEVGKGKGPLALFEALVQSGQLRDDAQQRQVMEYLNAVFHGAPRRTAKGLYVYGSVGCGKTMSMDLFYTAVQGVPGLRVDRKHFHDFLHGVQIQLHKLKRDGGAREGHPVEIVGEQLADTVDVLCFDEFAVTTIQDCVLLMPLFNALFRRGVTVVATSNRAPEDLYSDGLNRHLYLPPFLQSLHANCKVHHLHSSTDYRTVHYENSADAGVFCWPSDPEFVDRWFQDVTAGRGGSQSSVDVSFGRSIRVPQLSDCGKIARFSFDELCRSHLSADDYLSLSRQFHTILLDDVPCLSVDDHNEARRFTTLVDSCYENNVRLICSMAGPPEKLLGGLSGLREMSVSALGSGQVGCGDGDTSPSSSGVLQAIDRIKTSLAERRDAKQAQLQAEGIASTSGAQPGSTMDHEYAIDVLGAEVERVRAHGNVDMDVWRQGGERAAGGKAAPPQVSKAWDDRRRISQFTWESGDPTAEQQTIKGVFTAAVASLKESGFAVDRAISRLKEMQTDTFQENHRLKHLAA